LLLRLVFQLFLFYLSRNYILQKHNQIVDIEVREFAQGRSDSSHSIVVLADGLVVSEVHKLVVIGELGNELVVDVEDASGVIEEEAKVVVQEKVVD